jgi:hypothetical protein
VMMARTLGVTAAAMAMAAVMAAARVMAMAVVRAAAAAIATATAIAALKAMALGNCDGSSSNEDGCHDIQGKNNGNVGNGVGDN